MSPAPNPGIEGAILSILNDPIATLALARQIDRENGEGTTANLQAAAIDLISGAPFAKDAENEPAVLEERPEA